jgi:hypothetical protein
MSLNYTASISGELWTCDVLPERVDLTPAHTVWLGGPGPSPSPFKQRKQLSEVFFHAPLSDSTVALLSPCAFVDRSLYTLSTQLLLLLGVSSPLPLSLTQQSLLSPMLLM